MKKLAIFTLGLFDKDTKRQELSMDDAYNMIDNIMCTFLLENYTTIECRGHWTMRKDENGKGVRVSEPSIMIRVADDHSVPIERLCKTFAASFNQESVMVEYVDRDIDFIG